jgi:hypothetical protein
MPAMVDTDKDVERVVKVTDLGGSRGATPWKM